MPKKNKGKGQGANFRGFQSATSASRLADNQGAFQGSGMTPANQRVAAAKRNITKLTQQGVRINPNTATAFTQKAMANANAPSQRLNKLFKVR